jgi:hypothetical protein
MPKDYKKYENPMDDGRRKIHPDDHDIIKAKYSTGNYSWKTLAVEYGVTKGVIGMIVSDKYRERIIAYRKGHWKIYADKDIHKLAIRSYRKKKKELGLSYNKNPVLKQERYCVVCGKAFVGHSRQKYCDPKHRWEVYKNKGILTP